MSDEDFEDRDDWLIDDEGLNLWAKLFAWGLLLFVGGVMAVGIAIVACIVWAL